MSTAHGDSLLQPLVLSEDEAELLLSGLAYLSKKTHSDEHEAQVNQLYDKIKDAPR